MTAQAVLVNLPENVYARVREEARQGNTSVEDVLTSMAALYFPWLPEDLNTLLDAMQAYTDEQLWRVVFMRFSLADEKRMRDLTDQEEEQGSLSPEQAAELEEFLKQVQRQTLLRAKALLLLKQRGYDMENFLNLDV
jgi:hypothetical protein